ncbi:hypothetical protein JTB14_013794 [Gonioctena quinquepunctata]|nr:hypothetical protein JTB14_013794 [Gonioctena quinquepunctata]
MNDIGDVVENFPGLLKSSVDWFKIYKLPDGKPENKFAFDGKAKTAAFAHKIIDEVHTFWKELVNSEVDPKDISCANTTLKNNPFFISSTDAKKAIEKTSNYGPPKMIGAVVDKVHYLKRDCKCKL